MAERIALAALFGGCLLSGSNASTGQRTSSEQNPYPVQFKDVTAMAGIHFHHERAASPDKFYVETMGAGAGWIDYDQDGFMDAILVNSGYTPDFHPSHPPQPALYHNNRNGTFTDVTRKVGLHSDGTIFFGVAVGDYDNDGYPDIYMTGYRHSVLYHNKGNGRFSDVTSEAEVGDDGAWGTAAGWFDYDRDSRLDLLVTNYVAFDFNHNVVCGGPQPELRNYCHPDNYPGAMMRLYHNDGDGKFSDVTEKAGLINPEGKSLALVLADLNDDGWTDIFIANDEEPNFVYFNRRGGTFLDATYSSGAGFSEEGRAEAGMSADAADITGTGVFDIFVSHLDYQLNRLYHYEGDETFSDATAASGLGQTNLLNSAFGARFFDFDNDGWRDLLVINGHVMDNIALVHPGVTYAEEKRLYRNVGSGRFVDVTAGQGADFRARHVGRGLAVGDFDNDGWPDFLVNNNGEDAQLFHNLGAAAASGTGNHWLELRLIGTRSNRDAIGSRLELTAGGFVSHAQVKGGMSYCSAQDPRVHFGLGKHKTVDTLKISWPSGSTETLKEIVADRIVTIVEGKGILDCSACLENTKQTTGDDRLQ